MVILNQEAKDVFIGDSVLDHILVQAIAEYFLGGDILLGVLNKNGSAGESEYLEIAEEIDDVLVAFAKVATVALVENHDELLVPQFLNPLVVEVLLNGGIQFLDGCKDDFLVRF